MENQHRLISGYRDLSQAEIDAMNRIKETAEQARVLCEAIGNLIIYGDGPDARWVSIARTHLQQGFMALTRAVAKPTTF
jgi:hypothetical protein